MHAGLPKTGTTHVQLTFAANRRRLADQGILYPRVARSPQHFHATLDFLQMQFGAVDLADVAGAWDALRDTVNSWPGRAVVSHELLASATPDDVGRLVSELAPAQVHLLVGMRDVSRLLPAVWQERAKNGSTERWTDFRSAVARGAEVADPHPFWKLHDVEKVVGAWSAHLPPERIHVVTMPASRAEPELLVRRFGAVIGADVSGFSVPEDPANASIGVLELAVLRQVNAAARRRLDKAAYTTRVKRYLVPQVLARRPGQVRVVMPESEREWVDRYTARVTDLLRDGGLDLVGSLDDLTPTSFAPDSASDPAQTGRFPPSVVARAVAEVLVDVIAAEGHPPADAAPAPPSAPAPRSSLRRRLSHAVRRLARVVRRRIGRKR